MLSNAKIEKQPKLITGGKHIDERGQLDFINDFDMSAIKRVYFTTHFDIDVIRAWQGHKIESRWFICIKGSFKVKLVAIDDWDNPSENLRIDKYTLSDNEPAALYIPDGYVNGFKAIEQNSKLMIMSNYGLNEIVNDQVRFDKNKWDSWGS